MSVDGAMLAGILAVPEDPAGLVVFAHGSGSSRLSSRNRFVAEELNDAEIATLLFDLLTEEEDEVYERRFDIALLAARLEQVLNWATTQKGLGSLPVGLFGASTGAAAALVAAARLGSAVHAVVSRGGRPDLAMADLQSVTAPTLLLVGGDDGPVVGMNQEAHDALLCEKKLSIIPGATHLFEEPGALEQVATQASEWFSRHFQKRRALTGRAVSGMTDMVQ